MPHQYLKSSDPTIIHIVDIVNAVSNKDLKKTLSLCPDANTKRHALKLSIEYNCPKNFKKLINKIEPNHYPELLVYIAQYQRNNFAKIFLNQDVILNYNKLNWRQISNAIIAKNNVKLLTIMSQLNFDLHAENEFILYKAAQLRQLECVEFLLKQNVNLKLMEESHTPLITDYFWLFEVKKILSIKEEKESLANISNNEKQKKIMKL